MNTYTVYFECKYKFGSRKVEAANFEEAKTKAKPLIQNGAWCDNRCDKCKLKLTK
jgi:hypothetical protein